MNDVTTWSGITWNENGRVTGIDLYYKYLSGKLDVSDFTSLEVLICSGNNLTELNVKGCSALKTLLCNDNNMISLDVSGLDSLAELNYENNYIEGANQKIKQDAVYSASDIEALKTILSASDIYDLSASLNNWTCADWEKVDGEYRCVSLDISGMGLTGELNLSSLIQLRTLICTDNEYDSIVMTNCNNLEIIKMSKCPVTYIENGDQSKIALIEHDSSNAIKNDSEVYVQAAEMILDNKGVIEVVHAEEESELDKATDTVEDITVNEQYSDKISAWKNTSDEGMAVFTVNVSEDVDNNSLELYVAEYEGDNFVALRKTTGILQEENKLVFGIDLPTDREYKVMLWDNIERAVVFGDDLSGEMNSTPMPTSAPTAEPTVEPTPTQTPLFGYEIDDVTVSEEKVIVNVIKKTQTSGGKLIVAVYDNQNMLIAVSFKDVNGGENQIDVSTAGAKYVTSFIWNDILGMMPMCDLKSVTLE